MPNFAYEGTDRTGQTVQGMIDAADQQQAIVLLRKQGVMASKVILSRTGAGIRSRRSSFSFGRVSQKALTDLTRQLSTLINAGLPIVKSLNIVETQLPKGRLKTVVMDIADNVQSGTTLSEALSRYPSIFDKLYINMVKAGELGGALDTVLERLAEFKEKSMRLRRKIIAALVYPVIVMILAVAILMVLMIFVIPSFRKLFEDLKVPLPGMTQSLLSTAGFVQSYWFLVLLSPVAVIFLYKAIQSTRNGKYMLDGMKLRMPVFGKLIQKTAISRFSRTLATMSSSGVSILEALSVIKDATGNAVIGRAIGDVYESIKEGETIAKPMRASGVFDEIVVNMINVGEETGELDKMLNKVADNYENEVDSMVSGLVSTLEPILIVGMGVMVGVIVISLFLPLLTILDALGKKRR